MLAVHTSGNAYYDKGMAKAYDAIYERFVAGGQAAEREEGYVNFLGFSELDYPGSVLARELVPVLQKRNIHVLSDWGYGDTCDAWPHALKAEKNIVMSAGGLAIARRMQREAGMPFAPLYGLDWLDGLAEGFTMKSDPRILVVGEQITSNTLRRLLRKCGARAVGVATFFTLDAECREREDVHLKGEGDLSALVGERGYDFVIGDRALMPCCAGTHFVSLMHPPSGFGKRDNTEVSRRWLGYLVEGIDKVMEEG